MRYAIVLQAVLAAMGVTAMSTSAAHAQQFCGFSARPGAIVQCGYSSLQSCENAIGKGAMCFINPYLVLNTRPATRVVHSML